MKIQLADTVYRGLQYALDWIYPPVCAGCREPGYCLCSTCQESIHTLTGNFCKICGSSVKMALSYCANCQTKPPSFTAMRNFAEYEGVIRECLHALKYENNQGLGGFFSGQLASIVNKEGWQVDFVTPVPLSPYRLKERGYNQAALIARPLAARLNIRYNPFCLRRIRHTSSQVGLSLDERHHNVAGAFEATPDMTHDKNVLLVDDVMTTGATFNACATAFKDAGAKGIYCLTIARFSMRLPVSTLTYHQV